MAKYTVTYNAQDRGLPTLFKYKRFTINSAERDDWDYNNLEQYLINYEFSISPEVMQKYAKDAEITEVLTEMVQEKSCFSVDNNKSKRYSGRNQYIRCVIPVSILRFLKKLFVSTLVYDAEGMELKEKEFMKFEFDTEQKTVVMVDLHLYIPHENPYYKYAKNAVSSLSIEAIGLENYAIGGDKAVKDFYDTRAVSGWKEAKKLEKETAIEDKAGVYMLYDANHNLFYVGKAIRLKERMLQHRKNPNRNDPIPDFTHYRYSVINGEYYEFLYLIENAAIHDGAWLLNMPNAKNYTAPLAKEVSKKGKHMEDIYMVNTQEHQTRKQ